jgi:hypothetical protein
MKGKQWGYQRLPVQEEQDIRLSGKNGGRAAYSVYVFY